MKAKAEKIKENIVLSIKYARLKEEAADAEKKLLDEKKADKCRQFIESVNEEMNKIRQKYNPNAYSLVVNNKIEKRLKQLSKQKNSGLIKYGIAVETISDDDFEYTDNTSAGFVEKISSMLFDSKNNIKKIEDDYKKISNRIYGTSLKNAFEDAAQAIPNPLNDAAAKATGIIPKKALAVAGAAAGAAAFGLKVGHSFFKQKYQAKKLSALPSSDFAKRLIISAMSLSYAKNHFESEVQYRNFFRRELEKINLDRKAVMKKLFEEQYETEEQQHKLKFLHNFDDYLVEQINQNNKKR